GIEAQPDAAFATQRFQFSQQRLRDRAFAVIADDDCVRVWQLRFDGCQKAFSLSSSEIFPRFAINAYDLLRMCDDARFQNGVAFRTRHETATTDLMFTKQRTKFVRGVIHANGAEKFGLNA